MLYKKCVPQFEKKTQTLLAWLFIYTSFNLKKKVDIDYTLCLIFCVVQYIGVIHSDVVICCLQSHQYIFVLS